MAVSISSLRERVLFMPKDHRATNVLIQGKECMQHWAHREVSGLKENVSHRPVYLNAYSPDGGAVWEGYGAFRIQSLCIGRVSLGVGFESLHLPLTSCSFLLLEMDFYPWHLLPWLHHHHYSLSCGNCTPKQTLPSITALVVVVYYNRKKLIHEGQCVSF